MKKKNTPIKSVAAAGAIRAAALAQSRERQPAFESPVVVVVASPVEAVAIVLVVRSKTAVPLSVC